MTCPRLTALLVVAAVLAVAAPTRAQEVWLEVKSPRFTVISNAGEGTGRDIAWQFEQFRGAIELGWPWARVKLDRPVVVIAVKDESSMKRLLPEYWEQARGIRPASVLTSAPDRHYIAIRSDVRDEDNSLMNPYRTAYWSYAALTLNTAFDRNLPLWFRIGMAEVLSNTVVRDTELRFGLPIPQHIGELREGRLSLQELLTLEPTSPYFTGGATRSRFDAQAWSVIHYLLFGRPEDKAGKINDLATLLLEGRSSVGSVEQVFGSLDALQSGYMSYTQQPIFKYARLKIDGSTASKSYPTRRLSLSESSAMRARFHVATNRPIEARTLIADIRKTDAESALSHEVEALQYDRDGKAQEARLAFTRAEELKSTHPYVYYRLATLTWGANPDAAALARVEALLRKATTLDENYAQAYVLLAETLARGGPGEEAVTAATKAMAVAPQDPRPRLALARLLWQMSRRDVARGHALAAQQLARTDQERAAAQQVLDFFKQNER
jgi:tetratricopeptide (TPR) repeat protein